MLVSRVPTWQRKLPLPKPPELQPIVSARVESSDTQTPPGRTTRRKEVQSQSLLLRRGPTGKYCEQPSAQKSESARHSPRTPPPQHPGKDARGKPPCPLPR